MDLYTQYLSPSQWMRYAGFWRRLLAAIVDVAMLVFMGFAVAMLAVVVLVAVPAEEWPVAARGAGPYVAAVVALLLAWGYSAGFECSSSQGTIGKTTLGVAVCDGEGRRIGFGRASIRFAGKLLTCLTLGLGFAMLAFDERRRGLDDRLAGTVVIQRDPFALPPSEQDLRESL